MTLPGPAILVAPAYTAHPHVFAYRLIARDTVEEKILELQKTKREIADAIITADNGVLASLSRENLELLLS